MTPLKYNSSKLHNHSKDFLNVFERVSYAHLGYNLFENTVKLVWWAAILLQSLVSHDPSEIMLIFCL